jgi:hypothetical protein
MNRDVHNPYEDKLPFMINGLAIYRMNHRPFVDFLSRVKYAYAMTAFDIMIYSYRVEPSHWKKEQCRYGHLFVFTEFVYHYGGGKTPVSLTSFLNDGEENHDDTYFFHGPVIDDIGMQPTDSVTQLKLDGMEPQ